VTEPREIEAFLLSVEWKDSARGIELTLWARSTDDGPIRATIAAQEAVMFVPRAWPTHAGRRHARPLKTRDGLDVDAVYFSSQRALLQERDRIRADGGVTFESDLKPSSRFTMERFINGGLAFRGVPRRHGSVIHLADPQVRAAEFTPQLTTLSIDLETDGWDGPILSIALAGCGLEQVLMVRDGLDAREVRFFPDERRALEAAFAVIRQADPDVLLGWNVTDFDLRVLETRCHALGIRFAIGRNDETARVLAGSTAYSVSIARVPGRVVLDGVATLKNASWAFERYTLEHVAQQVVGRGKKRAQGVDPLTEIRRMHRDDPAALAAYNLEDARLALDIFEKAQLVQFAIARAKLTGLPLDRQGGSVAAFDHLYLPRLHRRGIVAPDVGADADPIASPGGHVLDSVPGLFTHVASFDFRSLYPSIVRTFQIDPLALWVPGEDPVQGFEGATFARHGAILPGLISHLHQERTKAREAGDETLSRAIKILMNSFYGVLGAPGCRFFDPRLASSITRRGHEIIERSRAFFEAQGTAVIYGDTDSLFVQLDPKLDPVALEQEGKRLAAALNAWWAERIEAEHHLESFLELRFETLYLKFLMPTMRGSEKGSKKRYAGLIPGGQLVIRGLEAVRTDWTPLAREAQRELLRRLFSNEPWEAWLLALRRSLLAGELDAQLIYRKRLRRGVEGYASTPPHVKVARQLAEAEPLGSAPTHEVEYVITTRGPEPLALRSAPIDYSHYLDKQLAPAIDVALGLLGTSFDQIAGSQLRLIFSGS
jgi:DNA polymerase II